MIQFSDLKMEQRIIQIKLFITSKVNPNEIYF